MSNLSPQPAPRKVRAWLGGVALAALVAGGSVGVGFVPVAPLRAEAPASVAAAAAALPAIDDVGERVKAAVVSVRVKTRQVTDRSDAEGGRFAEGESGRDAIERFLRRFGEGSPDNWQEEFRNRRFGERRSPERDGSGARPGPRGGAQGSGFFVSADGVVVTNNHVVENAAEVEVVTDDGRTLAATVLGTDPRTDLAVLKVKEGGTFPFVPFAGAAPRVGDWVVAIGNPFGLGGTVTAGIVSARGRDIGAGPYDDFLQIDAPVNRGNSGGPTFNLRGEVVGINTAIASPSGGSVGIAFAIPAEGASKVVAALERGETVSRGFIGVQIQPVTREIADAIGLGEARGALVAETVRGGPAERAGLRSGDTITAVDGVALKDARELSRRIAAIEPGRSAELTVWREGRERKIALEIARQNRS